MAWLAVTLAYSPATRGFGEREMGLARAGDPPPATVVLPPALATEGAVDRAEIASSNAIVADVPIAEQPSTRLAAARSSDDATFELVVRAETGEPIAGALVELGFTRASEDAESIRIHSTDARGRVRVDYGAGTIRACAWTDRSTAGPEYFETSAAGPTSAELALALAHEVTGVVVDAQTGFPIEDAHVSFWTFAERDVVRTRADGTFDHARFPASEFAEQIRVVAPGYGASVRYLSIAADGVWELPAALESETSATGTGVPFVEIALVPEVRLVGRIVDDLGEPIPGASASAEGFYHVLPDVAARDGAVARTAEDGSFELVALRSDVSHSLSLRAPGHGATSIDVPIGSTGTVDVGEVRLDGEAVVAGIVVDPDGHPVEDIEVTLVRLADGALPDRTNDRTTLDVDVRIDGVEHAGRTTREGVFVFDGLTPAAYRMIVHRDADALATALVEPGYDGTFAALEIELGLETLTLLGRVQAAAEGTTVRVHRRGAVAEVTVDANGRFRVAGVDASEPYTLTAVSDLGLAGPSLAAYATESPLLELGPLVAESRDDAELQQR